MLGVTATRYMSAPEIQARYNKLNNRLRRAITGTLKWLIRKSPASVISAGYQLKERSPLIARILQRYGVISSGNPDSHREFIPNPQRLALFRSKARVRIDKAREVLGYQPHFDLKNGMESTKLYVQWTDPDG